MYGLQIRKLVIVRIHTYAEEEPRVAAVDDARGAELDEVRLVLLVSGRDQAVDFAFEFHFFFVLGRERVSGVFGGGMGGGKGEGKGGLRRWVKGRAYGVWGVPFR